MRTENIKVNTSPVNTSVGSSEERPLGGVFTSAAWSTRMSVLLHLKGRPGEETKNPTADQVKMGREFKEF